MKMYFSKIWKTIPIFNKFLIIMIIQFISTPAGACKILLKRTDNSSHLYIYYHVIIYNVAIFILYAINEY